MTMPEIVIDVLLSLMVVVALGAATVGLVVLARRALQVKSDRMHALRLENSGNTRSLFRLVVESPEPALAFSLTYMGKTLIEVYEELQESSQPAGNGVTVSQGGTGKKGSAAAARSGPNAAVKTGRAVAGKAGILGSLLGGLGSLIPGAAGRQLKSQAQAARAVQQGTNQAIQAPQDAKRQAENLRSDSARLVGTKPEASASRKTAPARDAKTAPPENPQQVSMVRGRFLYYQTPEILPGQGVDLSLNIGSSRARYPQGSFGYTLFAEQYSPDFPEVFPTATQKSGVAHFPPVFFLRYWLPTLGSALVILGGLAALTYLLAIIWQ